MIEKKGKNNIFSKIISSQIFLAFLGLILIILISIPLAKNLSKRYYINQEIKDIEQEIIDLESKNKDLGKLISYLESDQFVEEQARLNLGLKKKGEEVVVIKEVEELIAIKSINDNLEDLDTETTNPKRWLSYFFSINGG